MRPSLWKEYEQIVNQYKEEGWGMYDDTSDVERAVILSDIYYGDHSSVVQLCQAVEKKVHYTVCKIIFGKETGLWAAIKEEEE